MTVDIRYTDEGLSYKEVQDRVARTFGRAITRRGTSKGAMWQLNDFIEQFRLGRPDIELEVVTLHTTLFTALVSMAAFETEHDDRGMTTKQTIDGVWVNHPRYQKPKLANHVYIWSDDPKQVPALYVFDTTVRVVR